MTVPSPDVSGVPNSLASVATTPGAAIVQAVGFTGVMGSFNPLFLQNGWARIERPATRKRASALPSGKADVRAPRAREVSGAAVDPEVSHF